MSARNGANGNGFRQVFAVPTLLAAVTAVGLLSALLEDGAWDVLSWLAMALPLLVIAVCWRRPPSR